MGAAGPTDLMRALRLMVITDSELAAPLDPLEIVEAALAAGATSIQVRVKKATSGQLLEVARRAVRLAEPHGALVLVNDRFDVALAAGAGGVHLGEEDVPVEAVRCVVPRDFVIGRSADTPEVARAAERAGADYLGVGSVFGTRTKAEVIGEAIGAERVAEVAEAVGIPVVGIGGIDASNAASVIEAGAAGVAVVSAVMSAEDPGRSTSELLNSM